MMDQNLVRLLFRKLLPIMLGTAVYAFGLYYFVIPNKLMEGGLTGLSLLLKYAFGLSPSIVTMVLNIPLFIVGWKVFGRSSMMLTIFGTISFSFFMQLMEKLIHIGWILPFTTHTDYLLAALYAGVTIGIGLGIVFRVGGTTGGSDIIARIGHKLKGWSVGQALFIIDVFVISISLFYLSVEKVLYTLVAEFIAARIINFIQEGAYAAKAFTVITELGQEMAELITAEMDRGVTIFPAKGAYSQKPMEVVYCVVYRNETGKLKGLVKFVDPQAFIIISDVRDVHGEGFQIE